MSFSDDPASPAAPFSGDSTGQIFDQPDMVSTSPTTTERIVDTQSGFLVVVKRAGDRLALSIKRRVGTPPSSSITLSPDESVKLSKILSSGAASADDVWRSRSAERERPRFRRGSRLTSEGELSETVTPPSSMSSTHVPMGLMAASVFRSFRLPILVVAFTLMCIGLGVGFCLGRLGGGAAPATVAKVSPLASENVDRFVRTFVGSMLDFNPETYKSSQIQAMSVMRQELLNRYWQETNFPLTNRQLKNLPQGVTILITELKQEPAADGTVLVDVRAQLTDPKNPKIATPVNLRLSLGIDSEQRIQVLEQQDLSAVTK